VQLGHGKYQHRIQATVSGRTPHIAVELASDKEETNKILASLGLPVPQQELVTSEARRCAPRGASAFRWSPSRTTAITGAASRSADDGRGSRAWLQLAKEHSRSVIVETFLEGDDHRLLVVNGELVAAHARTPGHVTGDGETDVVQLIEVVNQDPRRGVGHEKVLTRLELDAQAEKMLEKVGLTAQSVPAVARSCTCARPRIYLPAARPPT
jgi:cyanophycin synthetase